MAIKNSLDSLGFDNGVEQIKPRLIIGVDGMEKHGKSHFALTATKPIAYFNVDTGLEGVADKFNFKKNEFYRFDMYVPSEMKEAEATWEKFHKAYYGALNDPSIRTIVGDTATEWWELIRMARFGKSNVMPYQYGPVNKEFRNLIKDAYLSDKNIILLHKMKSVYINDKRTSEYERAGFSDTGYLVQVNCQVWREDATVEEDGTVNPGEFHLYVKDCRQNSDMAGQDLTAPFNEFPMLASLILGKEPGQFE